MAVFNTTTWSAPKHGIALGVLALALAGCGGNSDSDSGLSTAGDATPGTTPTTVAAPTIAAQPANMTVTELQAASFSVTAKGTAPLTYQWQRDGKPIAGATAATLTIPSALAADNGARFSVVVSNSAGSVASVEAVLTGLMPVFLLAGQSNMEGNVDTTLFNTLLGELALGTSPGIEARLAEHIRYWHKDTNNGYAGYGYSVAMAELEAKELVRLNAAGLVGANLTSPYAKVLCSMNATAVAPLSASAKCGAPFGPELVLGHSLGKAGYSATSLIKVATGGTDLYKNWRSPLSAATSGIVGPRYTELRSRIQSLKSAPASVNPLCSTRSCQWSAFIWFQGESDAFAKVDSESYAQNLKNLIADVRSEVGSPNLPVVIVQIGGWAQGLAYGKNVVAAQISFVKDDKHARIVNTADLSSFYHYDPAAQLIIGDRVSKAVQSLLAAAPTP